MSMMNLREQRVNLAPKRRRNHAFKDPDCRIRNQRWLTIQRQFGFTLKELAELLRRSERTVGRGVAAALVEDQADRDHFWLPAPHARSR